MRTHRIIALLGGVFVVGGLWLYRASTDEPATPVASTPHAGEAHRPAVPRLSGLRSPSEPAAAPHVGEVLASWRALWTETAVAPDRAQALIERRRAATADAIVAFGRGGAATVPALQRSYADASSSREKLLLIDALTENGSPEAVAELHRIYTSARAFKLREEALRGIGSSPMDEAASLLVTALHADDPRLQQIAAQSLYGREAALEPLIRTIHRQDAHMNVRLEAAHSLGGIGTEAARDALHAIVDGGLEARVRSFAAKVIARSFG